MGDASNWQVWVPPERTLWRAFKCWIKGHRFALLEQVELYDGDSWEAWHESQSALLGKPIACRDCGLKAKIGDVF